jgi:hypothetical protein
VKIFISWSGKPSLNVATALRDWLPYLFNGIGLFVSSEDIRKGKRWPLEVSGELEASNFGIVCLTPDNLEAPWLLFESGALSKSVKEASVFTLLTGGLRISDIEGPLSHFQHTMFEKEDFFKLMRSVNEALGAAKQDEPRLRKVFEKFWDELEVTVTKAVKPDSKPKKERSSEDMLRELLEITGYIARSLPVEDGRATATPPPSLPKFPFVTGTELWEKLLEGVGKSSPFTRSYLLEAQGGRLADGTFTIYFHREFEDHVGLVNNARNIALIQKVLSELGSGDNAKIAFRIWPPQVPEKK